MSTNELCNRNYGLETSRIKTEEEQLLDKHMVKGCPVTEISKHIGSMNDAKLKEIVSKEFYNKDVMDATSCLTEAIFYATVETEGQVDATRRINDWFSGAHRIGAESVSGAAILSPLRDAGAMMVLKVPQDPEDKSLKHELFVGVFGTNNARVDIPNFAYIYGGFECSYPIIDPDTKEVISLCGNPKGPKVQYIAYESVERSKSVRDSIENISVSNYFSTFMQVFFSTYYGWIKFDWTHGDLHDENVLLRNVSNIHRGNFYIKYPIGKHGDYYVQASEVATLIDFGDSHIKYNGKSYGRTFCAASLHPESSYPILDIYIFLMFSAYYMIEKGRTDLLRSVEPIFRYFNKTEDFASAVKKQREAYYKLPFNSEVRRSFTMDGLLSHLKQIPMFNKIVATSYDNQFPIFDCSLACRSKNGVFFETDTSLKASIKVKSLEDYYDMRSKVSAQEASGLRKQVMSNYEDFKREFFTEYESLFNDASERAMGLKHLADHYFNEMKISSMSIEDVLTMENLDAFRYNLISVAKLRSQVMRLESMQRIGYYAFRDLGDESSYNKIDSMQDNISILSNTLVYITDNFTRSVAKVKDYLRSPRGHTLLVNNSSLNWYFTNAKLYL